MKVTALVDRFGSNRLNAHLPAELFNQCAPKLTCVNLPFAAACARSLGSSNRTECRRSCAHVSAKFMYMQVGRTCG